MRNRHKSKRSSKWSVDELNQAIDAVTSKSMTLGIASLHFGIPKSTLGLKINGWKGRAATSNKHGAGHPTTLSKVQEEDLSSLLKTMNKWGFGLSKAQVLDTVQEFMVKSHISSRWKDNRPGKVWFRSFCNRNNLSLKKPELLESSRARQSNDPFIVYGFYELLTEVIKELGLDDKPELIFNADESGMKSDATSTKVVAGKGEPAQRESGGNGRLTTSVLACVSAAGEKFPPLIIHKGKRLWNSMLGDDPYPGTSYHVSEDGWMTQKVFHDWFRSEFLPRIKGQPALLIYDGHLSHISVGLVEEARRTGVTILKLPPHTSHILQPLDKTVFRGLKIRWDVILSEWSRRNRSKILSKGEFADLLGKAWGTINSDVIIKGFKSTGIYDGSLPFPVNFEAIPMKYFDPEKLRRFQNRDHAAATTTTAESTPLELSENITLIAAPAEVTIQSSTVNLDFQLQITFNPENAREVRSTNLILKTIRPNDSIVVTPTQVNTSHQEETSFESLLLKTLTPAPTQVRRKRKRIDVAEVITTESYHQLLQQQQQEKEKKLQEKVEARRRKAKKDDGENVPPKKARGRPKKQ